MKDDWGDGLAEGWGDFLVLLNGFACIGHEPWCSRAPHRALVAAIIRLSATHTEMIGGPAWTDIDLYVLHTWTVRLALGCHEGYRTISHGGPDVSRGPLLIASHTTSSHF